MSGLVFLFQSSIICPFLCPEEQATSYFNQAHTSAKLYTRMIFIVTVLVFVLVCTIFARTPCAPL